MKRHEYYEILVSRYKDGDLDIDETLELEEHMKNCKSCRILKNEISSLSDILSGRDMKIKTRPAVLKIVPYVISIAAVLVVIFGIAFTWKLKNGNISSNVAVALSDSDKVYTNGNILNDTIDDYTPLSGYFTYTEDNSSTNGTIIMMSAYMEYIGD